MQLKKDNLKSIAIPAIGTGNLRYPSDLVAETTIDACKTFLNQNKNDQFNIQIVIYEKDEEVFKVFIFLCLILHKTDNFCNLTSVSMH